LPANIRLYDSIQTRSLDEVVCELRTKTIKPEELAIYRVHREAGHTIIKEIEISIDGDDVSIYENWEKGISVP
jgi:hypothetical protein